MIGFELKVKMSLQTFLSIVGKKIVYIQGIKLMEDFSLLTNLLYSLMQKSGEDCCTANPERCKACKDTVCSNDSSMKHCYGQQRNLTFSWSVKSFYIFDEMDEDRKTDY